MGSLSIRKTHRYVGTYKHLDEHEEIGSYEIIGTLDLTDYEDDDPCEPSLKEHRVVVTSQEPENRIIEALYDSFSSHGCAHSHDCCGCRSYHVEDVTRWTGDLWKVQVSSSRNY